jgi:flagellar biosynthesis protein FlhF
VTEAMRQIRDDLGDNAVIISTQTDEDAGGVRITAALEIDDREDEIADLLGHDGAEVVREEITAALDYHGVPRGIAGPLVNAMGDGDLDNAQTGLEMSLRHTFAFRPLTLTSLDKPVMLVGPPGAGKTTTAARLATRATMERRALKVITTDNFRAGAEAQLAAFTDILDTELVSAEGPNELRGALGQDSPDTITIIDTAGANPFNTAEMTALSSLIETAQAEPVLVMAAGGDVLESAEIAACFQALGVKRMVVTRLDIARRLGAMLAVADAGRFALSDVSFSPQVARGMKSLTPQTLARLLMRDPTQPSQATPSEKAFAK